MFFLNSINSFPIVNRSSRSMATTTVEHNAIAIAPTDLEEEASSGCVTSAVDTDSTKKNVIY